MLIMFWTLNLGGRAGKVLDGNGALFGTLQEKFPASTEQASARIMQIYAR